MNLGFPRCIRVMTGEGYERPAEPCTDGLTKIEMKRYAPFQRVGAQVLAHADIGPTADMFT